MKQTRDVVAVALACLPLCASFELRADERTPPIGVEKDQPKSEEKLQTITLAEGRLKLTFPAAWKQTKPRNRIIQREFAIAPGGNQRDGEDQTEPGRMTVMSAGGSVEANVSRWIGQFRTGDGEPLRELQPTGDEKRIAQDAEGMIVAKHKFNDLAAHTVDLRGTFLDRPRGPIGPSVQKPKYRMLGLIIPTPKHGNWFVKLYGPQSVIDKQAKSFAEMVKLIDYSEQ